MRYTAKEIPAVFTARRMSVVMAGLLLGAACLAPQGGMAQVSGDCVNCHTMHNSQGGASLNPTTGGASASTVYRSLTKGNCVGCHTNTLNNAPTGELKTIPYVNHTTAPALTAGGTLAGGSFYWVGVGGVAANGHNVVGISGPDGTLTNIPPGGSATNLASAAQLSCAGNSGCHGSRTEADEYKALSGSHHAPKLTNNTADGLSLATSYRFLDGIKGIEDADWEETVSASDHNQYYGVGRAGTTSDAATDAKTISALCGQCHGAFHAAATSNPTAGTGISYGGNMTSPWVRHPTDFDMNTVQAKEYGAYGGVTNAYVPQVPVASDLAGGVLSTVPLKTTAKVAIVTCISCHRAHGSDQADLLRWDYTKMDAHASTVGETGCFTCHTTKDT